MARRNLDCKGISCPQPLIQISKAAREMTMGDELEVVATDPNFIIDIEAWAERTSHSIVSMNDEEDKMTVIIRIV